MNKEQKQFKRAIKQRKIRAHRRKHPRGRPHAVKAKPVVKVIKLSWWRRLINWLWRKRK